MSSDQANITNWQAAWLCLAGVAAMLGTIPHAPPDDASFWRLLGVVAHFQISLSGAAFLAIASFRHMRRWAQQR